MDEKPSEKAFKIVPRKVKLVFSSLEAKGFEVEEGRRDAC